MVAVFGDARFLASSARFQSLWPFSSSARCNLRVSCCGALTGSSSRWCTRRNLGHIPSNLGYSLQVLGVSLEARSYCSAAPRHAHMSRPSPLRVGRSLPSSLSLSSRALGFCLFPVAYVCGILVVRVLRFHRSRAPELNFGPFLPSLTFSPHTSFGDGELQIHHQFEASLLPSDQSLILWPGAWPASSIVMLNPPEIPPEMVGECCGAALRPRKSCGPGGFPPRAEAETNTLCPRVAPAAAPRRPQKKAGADRQKCVAGGCRLILSFHSTRAAPHSLCSLPRPRPPRAAHARVSAARCKHQLRAARIAYCLLKPGEPGGCLEALPGGDPSELQNSKSPPGRFEQGAPPPRTRRTRTAHARNRTFSLPGPDPEGAPAAGARRTSLALRAVRSKASAGDPR